MVPVQDCIGRFSPLLHVLWAVGGDTDDEVLNFSIRVAREDAWQQAVTLAHLDAERLPLAIDSLDRKVAVLARLVAQPGGVLEQAVDVVGFLESDDVVAVIDALAQVEPEPAPVTGPGTGCVRHEHPRPHDAGRAFIRREGRVLEQRLAATIFDGAPAAGVVDVLRGYQNPDGGFGHGLEPDKRCPDSLAIDVEVALQAMAAAGTVDHDMVGRACDFLASDRHAGRGGGPGVARHGGLSPGRALGGLDLHPRLQPDRGPGRPAPPHGHRAPVGRPRPRTGAGRRWRTGSSPSDAHAVSEVLVFLGDVPDRERADALAPAVVEHLATGRPLPGRPRSTRPTA